MAKHLKTVDKVIEWLGGADEVRALVGCHSRTTVPMWRYRGANLLLAGAKGAAPLLHGPL
jgi:hypothetical protein